MRWIDMKMLFFSADSDEVADVGKEFQEAGIPCEVRNGLRGPDATAKPGHAELWIQNDQDCHRAFLLCVRLGVGFAKRPKTPVMES